MEADDGSTPRTTRPDPLVGLVLIVESEGPGTTKVRLAGDLDLSTVEKLETDLRALIDDAAGRDIVLDVRELSFLDSTGLRALWSARQRALDVRARLHLQAPSDPVARVLRTTKLDKVFSVLDDDLPSEGTARSKGAARER